MIESIHMVVAMRYNHVQNHAIVRLSDRQDDKKLISEPCISEVSNNTEKYLYASGQILFSKFLAFSILFQKYLEPFILKLHL